MTLSDINASLTIGNANDDDLGIIKTTLGAYTSAFVLNTKTTMTLATSVGKIVGKLYFVCSPFSLTTAQARVQLDRGAKGIDIVAHTTHLLSVTTRSEIEVNNGGFLYTWFDALDIGDPGTVNLKLVEID